MQQNRNNFQDCQKMGINTKRIFVSNKAFYYIKILQVEDSKFSQLAFRIIMIN